MIYSIYTLHITIYQIYSCSLYIHLVSWDLSSDIDNWYLYYTLLLLRYRTLDIIEHLLRTYKLKIHDLKSSSVVPYLHRSALHTQCCTILNISCLQYQILKNLKTCLGSKNQHTWDQTHHNHKCYLVVEYWSYSSACLECLEIPIHFDPLRLLFFIFVFPFLFVMHFLQSYANES